MRKATKEVGFELNVEKEVWDVAEPDRRSIRFCRAECTKVRGRKWEVVGGREVPQAGRDSHCRWARRSSLQREVGARTVFAGLVGLGGHRGALWDAWPLLEGGAWQGQRELPAWPCSRLPWEDENLFYGLICYQYLLNALCELKVMWIYVFSNWWVQNSAHRHATHRALSTCLYLTIERSIFTPPPHYDVHSHFLPAVLLTFFY